MQASLVTRLFASTVGIHCITFPESVLDTALSKFCGGYDSDFDAQTTNHVSTVLGQRFGVNVTVGLPAPGFGRA